MASDPKTPTYILSVRADLVEVWSKRRLPFETKGWLSDLRSELRSHLERLDFDRGWLHAQYVSDDDSYCDVENVLFYNVGPSYLKKAVRNGIVFERGYDPPAPPRLTSDFGHYARYQIAEPGKAFDHWTRMSGLVAFGPVALEKTSPAAVWAAIKKAAPAADGRQASEAFGVEVRLAGLPRGKPCHFDETHP